MLVTAISINFGAGVSGLSLAPEDLKDRLDNVRELIGQLRSDSSLVAFQEFPSLLEPRKEAVSMALRDLGATDASYLPLTTSDWHPFHRKWGGRWDVGVGSLQEGLLSCAFGDLLLSGPSLDDASSDGSGLCITLPTFEISLDRPRDTSGWLEHRVRPWENDSRNVWLRPTWYQGYRDTDPRAAIAQVVSTLDGTKQFVAINVHLATLVNEQSSVKDALRGRSPSETASLARFLQLSVLRDFVIRVYSELRLPVIILGDFNCSPASPELDWFISTVGLRSVFQESNATSISIAEKNKLLAQADLGTSVENNFTHIEEGVLIDNILFTSPTDSRAKALRTRLLLLEENSEIEAGICYSAPIADHAPIWSRFEVEGC